MKDDIDQHKCGVCGGFCFASPDGYRWHWKGELKMCGLCYRDWSRFEDPAREYRMSVLEGEIAEAEELLGELEYLYERLLHEE